MKPNHPKTNNQKTKSVNAVKSSFRDPAGFMFAKNGQLFRQINPFGFEDYEAAEDSGLYKDLFKKNLLVKHKIISKDKQKIILEPAKVPFVSYPFEWSFSMLKDAALTTLAIQKIALKHDMSLKDATAYNIQFLNSSPILIDTLSFEKYQNGKPWVAYGQFCRHFFAPLALMAYKDVNLSQLMRLYIDGIPLDLTTKLLPTKSKFFKPGVFMHIALHAKAQDSKASEHKQDQSKLTKTNQLAIIDSLERSIKNLNPKNSRTEWMDYYNITNYSDQSAKNKKTVIQKMVKPLKINTAVDLGGNNGEYSRVLSKNIKVACADIDPWAVEYNYRQTKKTKETNILPLVVDLINPGGALGWANAEREPVDERLQSDLAMALALIHHLAISNNLPFALIADYFSKFAPYLIIEFVPKEDSQVKKLLSTRKDIFNKYDEENFEKEFKKFYKLVKKEAIPGTKRTLYLFNKR